MSDGFEVYISDRDVTKKLHLINPYGYDIAENFIKSVKNNGIEADGSITAEKYNLWVDILDAIPAVVNAAIDKGNPLVADAFNNAKAVNGLIKEYEGYSNEPA
jgi:tRNA(Leu) C34 or U34 (ribose-2'-O)-methylase TrmL